jgi:hypothetical protein
MKQGEKLYKLESSDSPYSSTNTQLIAVLLLMGAKLDETQPYQEFREMVNGLPQRRIVWLLKERTESGVPVKDIVALWRNKAWLEANPGTRITIAQEAITVYRQLVDAIKKAVPCSIIRRGRRMVVIPENASEERRAELMKHLEAA